MNIETDKKHQLTTELGLSGDFYESETKFQTKLGLYILLVNYCELHSEALSYTVALKQESSEFESLHCVFLHDV